MRVRRAVMEDCGLVFEWANDPVAREASVHSAVIPWEDHLAWFAKRLSDPSSDLFIGEDDADEPVGIVRFGTLGDEAEIGINVAPSRRGAGVGVALIDAGCRALFEARDAAVVVAYVKEGNFGSQKAFERAGFVAAEPREWHGAMMLRYERRRDG